MKAAAVLLVFSLAGCLAGEGAKEPAAMGPETDVIQEFLHMDGCTGFSVSQDYAPGTHPAQPPSGWPRDDGVGTVIVMLLWQCERVGLDGLERQATLLWERANNAFIPESCREGISGGGSLSYVLNVVTDDAVLADRLRTAYGLPVHESVFHFDQSGHIFSVEWGSQESPSFLRVLDDGTRDQVEPLPARWVWSNETASAWMDVERNHERTILTGRTGFGQLGTPHLLGVGGVYAGTATMNHDAELQGSIELRRKDCA